MDESIDLNRLVNKVISGNSAKIHLLSKSFWNQVNVKRRTPKAVSSIKDQLTRMGIEIILEEYEFGKEPEDQWLELRYWDIPIPDDLWFKEMSEKSVENEQEVDVFFLTPLFSMLGYAEEDFTFEYPVDISPKFSKRRKGDRLEKVDLVPFNGTDRSRSNILVVCEAKKPDNDKSSNKLKNFKLADQESKIYCTELNLTKRRMATNGDLIKIYKIGEKSKEILVLETHRSELKEKWHQLYLCLGKLVLLGKN